MLSLKSKGTLLISNSIFNLLSLAMSWLSLSLKIRICNLYDLFHVVCCEETIHFIYPFANLYKSLT